MRMWLLNIMVVSRVDSPVLAGVTGGMRVTNKIIRSLRPGTNRSSHQLLCFTMEPVSRMFHCCHLFAWHYWYSVVHVWNV